MNSARLRTVAFAIQNREQDSDPGFYAGRYATRKDLPLGPDVGLAHIDRDVDADVAAWTCYQYPDLCEPLGIEHWWNQGLFYWTNARQILGLTDEQADSLFCPPGVCEDSERYTSGWAVGELYRLATEGDRQKKIEKEKVQ